MAVRLNNPAIQHFDKATNAPLEGGQLFFFETGTSTPKDTFSDSDGLIANTNPVILDGKGFEPDIFGVGTYRIVLRAPPTVAGELGVQQWERDPVEFTTAAGLGFQDWDSTVTYNITDIVRGSDNLYYVCIVATSLNQDPTTTPTDWSQFYLYKVWNTNENYVINDIVTSNARKLYAAVQANSGVDPDTDTSNVNWRMVDNLRFSGSTITAVASSSDMVLQTNGLGDINLVAGGDINLNQTGDLLSNGNELSLAEITQQIFITGIAQIYTETDSNVKYVRVQGIGGGGAGGGAGTTFQGGGQGGGAGAYFEVVLPIASISGVTYTVGIGGTGVIGSAGNNGTATTISGVFATTAAFGIGGQPSATNLSANGGLATTPTGGLGVAGGDGNPGTRTFGAVANLGSSSGNVGASFFGGGGGGVSIAVNFQDGFDGRAFGSGGGGGAFGTGATGGTGGDGAGGLLIFTEYR